MTRTNDSPSSQGIPEALALTATERGIDLGGRLTSNRLEFKGAGSGKSAAAAPPPSSKLLSYENLSKIWDENATNAPADCVKSCNYVARIIARQFSGKAVTKPVKMFKYGVEVVKGDEHTQANERYEITETKKRRYADILGDTITVYKGYSSNITKVTYRLKPGMLVYTSEYSEWLKERDPKTGKYMKGKYVFKNGKQLSMWSKKHMRMYVGKGEFRDNKDWRGTRSGKPVYRGTRLHYVVLAVYDPFAHLR